MPDQNKPNYDDRPIEGNDQDMFGFLGYASVLANRVLQASPPLTIGVFGSWGSGKSSLMNLLNKQINENPKIHTVEINVWELSNQEEVWHAFLQALFSKVSKELWWFQKIDWRKFFKNLFVNSYKIVVAVVPVILGGLLGASEDSWNWDFVIKALTFGEISVLEGSSALIGYIVAGYFVLKPALKEARNAVNFDVKSLLKYDSYQAQISELTNLKSRFEKMVKTLVKEDGRLVVFIDDLDRCTPDKIPDVIEAIKLFTTSNNCIYVLGLDHEIVRKGISKKYEFDKEDENGSGREEAAEYLEKIIQIPFHLPPIESGYIQDFIGKIYQKDVVEICPTAPEIFSKGLVPNPRMVKRALNIYRTLWDLAEDRWKNWEMEERVDPELLAKMVVVQTRYRPLYDYLKERSEHIVPLQEIVDLMQEEPETDLVAISEKWNKFVDESPYVESDFEILDGLNRFLTVGKERFTKENAARYIFMTAAAEGVGVDTIKASREEKVALLGSNPVEISNMVEDIQGRGETEEEREQIINNYKKRLDVSVLEGQRFSIEERLSADISLDHFEDRVRKEFEPQTVLIPAGEFLMGSVKPPDEDQTQQKLQQKSNPVERVEGEGVPDPDAQDRELPQHTITLPEYYIGRYPVTNVEYRYFVQEAGHPPPEHWKKNEFPAGLKYHPVVRVIWHDAVAYCQWLSKKTEKDYRLPSEAEWEKAARGGEDGRIYPWGDQWNQEFANTFEGGKGGTTVIGSYPLGKSPYGVLDMSGNVWEWTRSLHKKYKYDPSDGREEMAAEDSRVLRGGSFYNDRRYARCADRFDYDPGRRLDLSGFRVMLSPFPSEQSEGGPSGL